VEGLGGPHAAAEHVAAYALTRLLLSKIDGRPPASWSFARTPTGKPIVETASNRGALTFSRSHTGGFAAVAVTAGAEVGLDVERRDRRLDARQLSARYFLHSELCELQTLDDETARRRFLQQWTAKEALLKAAGTGLRELASIDVSRGHFNRAHSGTSPALRLLSAGGLFGAFGCYGSLALARPST
jgi:4'-phosphopantetheinyl transferase